MMIKNLRHLMSVAMVTTIVATGATFATENNNGKNDIIENNNEIIKSQNQDYAYSLFVDSVLNNEGFKKTLNYYQQLESNSFVEDENYLLEKGSLQQTMQTYYDKYCQLCTKENVSPFKPGKILSFLWGNDTGNQKIVFVNSSEEISNSQLSFMKLNVLFENSPLCPSIAPQNMFETISGYLFPKFNSFFMSKSKSYKGPKFQETDLDFCDVSTKQQVLSLFETHIPNVDLTASHSMIMFCQNLLSFPSENKIFASASTMWDVSYEIRPLISNKIPLVIFGGVKSGKLFVNTTDLLEQIENFKNHGYMNNDRYTKEQALQDVFSTINQKFNVNGKQYFDFSKEGEAKAAGEFLKSYILLIKGMVDCELKIWDTLTSKIENLTTCYKFVMDELSQAEKEGTLFSGISVSPYSMSIIETGNKEKAEDTKFLKKVADKHMTKHKKELDEYEKAKDYLPTIRGMQKWIEEIFDYLKKKGRLS